MSLTNHPSNVESVYRYFSAANVGYNLLHAIVGAATLTHTFSRMRNQQSADQLSACICRAMTNAADELMADQHALVGDPAINWAVD